MHSLRFGSSVTDLLTPYFFMCSGFFTKKKKYAVVTVGKSNNEINTF